MDKDRQIRFLYPPLFFLAFLWWAYHSHPLNTISEYLKAPSESKESLNKILGLIAAGGAGVLVLGFLLGTISIVFLTGIFWFRKAHYAAVWPPKALGRLWPKLDFKKNGKELAEDKKWTLYATATFYFCMLPKGIQAWMMRRWSAFIISTNTVVGLLIVMAIVRVRAIDSGILWWITTIIVALFLAVNGCIAWKEYMTMLDFQSHRDLKRLKNRDISLSETGDNDSTGEDE